MNQQFQIPVTQPDELLAEAVSRHCPVTVSCRLSDGWANCKSRFLGLDEETGQLIIEYPTPGVAATPEFAGGECIGVAFRRGHKKCVFSTAVSGQCRSGFGKAQNVPTLRLVPPTEIFEMQRRMFYRAPVPENKTIPVTIAGCAAAAGNRDKPMTYSGTMLDVSAGGISMSFLRGSHPRWELDQVVNCSFQVDAEPPLALLSRLRYCEQISGDRMRLGLQFAGLEASPVGREQLQQLMDLCARFQRVEMDRISKGPSSTGTNPK